MKIIQRQTIASKARKYYSLNLQTKYSSCKNYNNFSNNGLIINKPLKYLGGKELGRRSSTDRLSTENQLKSRLRQNTCFTASQDVDIPAKQGFHFSTSLKS